MSVCPIKFFFFQPQCYFSLFLLKNLNYLKIVELANSMMHLMSAINLLLFAGIRVSYEEFNHSQFRENKLIK